MAKQLTEEKVREIVLEAVEAVLSGMDRMFQDERKERRAEIKHLENKLENKIDFNQELNNKQFDELKAELSNTVSKTEFNAVKKSFQN